MQTEQSLFDLHNYYAEAEEQAKIHKRRRVKRQKKETKEPIRLDTPSIEGVIKVVMSSITQRAIQCEVGTDITAQNAWKYVSKNLLHDYIELQDGFSAKQFAKMKLQIKEFPNPDILVAYLPSDEDFDEFCICLTLAAEKEFSARIDAIEKDQEEKLNNALSKSVQKWKSRGSEVQVDLQVPKNNRPLLEVEIETVYPIMSAKCRFKLRLAEEARDGYICVLPGRAVLENVVKRRIDACIQAIPEVRSSEAQTICTYPENVWTQYCFDPVEVKEFSKAFKRNISHFIESKLNVFEDMVYLNSFVNFYTSDYKDLVKDLTYSEERTRKMYTEFASFSHYDVCKGRTVVAFDWHPMWSGTFAAAYSTNAITSYSKGKSTIDEVDDATFRVPPVLFWCFNDTLSPKLYLESPREVSAISFCPFNENLLVGGCINGQIVIWDLTGKLEMVETEEILTTQQEKYRKLMHSLIPWMKNIRNIKVVQPAVTSNITYSHSEPVTSIKWISPYLEITRSGQLKHIGEEEKRTSLQFISSSQDGTVLAWDLNLNPMDKSMPQVTKRKRTRLKSRPAGLITDVSPFTVLNRILKPIFKVNIFAPESTRNLPLATLHFKDIPCHYVEKFPDPNRTFDITKRLYFEPVLSVSQEPLINQLQIGSMEGDFLTVSWEGFSFNAGEAVNKELGKIQHISKFHDGPIVSLQRSHLYPEVILTVGGQIFALWILKSLKEPIFWRKSKHRYTCGLWNTHLHSAFRLTRSDGCVEVWYLKVRSDRYYEVFCSSGGNITGTFTHPLILEKGILAVADYKGSLRLGFARNILDRRLEEKCAMAKLCEREVDRKVKIKKWQEDWAVRNAEWVKLRKEQESLLKQKKEKGQLEQDQILVQHKQPPEELKVNVDKWRLKEEKRMQFVLMEKKALDISLLEKQRQPLLKILQDKSDKIIKMKERQNNASEIFSETAARLFPDAVEKTMPTANIQEDIITDDVRKDIYQNYLQVEKANSEIVNKNKYTKPFNWILMCKAGKERRKALDGFYGYPTHKLRRIREQNDKY